MDILTGVAGIADAIAKYKLAGLLLGTYFGPVLILASAYLMMKVLGKVKTLTELHNDQQSEFAWSRIPGIVAAVIVLGVFLFAVGMGGFGVFVFMHSLK